MHADHLSNPRSCEFLSDPNTVHRGLRSNVLRRYPHVAHLPHHRALHDHCSRRVERDARLPGRCRSARHRDTAALPKGLGHDVVDVGADRERLVTCRKLQLIRLAAQQFGRGQDTARGAVAHDGQPPHGLRSVGDATQLGAPADAREILRGRLKAPRLANRIGLAGLLAGVRVRGVVQAKASAA
eukprot:3426274-Prymnesium_polylepis.1